MKIYTIEAGVFGTNTYLVGDEETGKAVLLDPDGSGKQILKLVEQNGFALEAILLTHGHFDHIGAVDELVSLTGVPVYISERDAELLTDGRKNASSVFFGKSILCQTVPQTFKNKDMLTFGNLSFSVMLTPGHTRGSVCFFLDDDIVFTGDTFFAEGYGRTDLYGGNENTIISSLQNLVPRMRGKTVYPGHGEPVTL
ncbi:MAG: MBL fold metallo-hydrolase [Clostridia bacterium]|nr:MBL fold metallo-hydrolase [Clostridia bacterium]